MGNFLNDYKLILPAVDLAESYASYVEELREKDELPVPFVLRMEFDRFEELVDSLHGFPQGVGVAKGLVEHTTFWLIDADRNLLGVSNLRHRLTPRLLMGGGHIGFGVRPSARGRGIATRQLALTLREARKMDIEKAMLSCFETNLASAAVIRRNGGVLDSTFVDDEGNVLEKYWIDILELSTTAAGHVDE